MILNTKIYQQIRILLYNRYSYPIDQIQPHLRFQIELGVDSLEMFEIITEFEEIFNINISLDDIDDFIFQPQKINYISDIKSLTIQNAVDYIEEQIIIQNKSKK